MTFKGILLSQSQSGVSAELRELTHEPLADEDVDLRVTHSTLNFKDALAITGSGPIVKTWPMVPGIDCAGVVEESRHPVWQRGDRVVVTGWGLGESVWGGLAERCRIKGEWALAPPSCFDGHDCMVIGTAGVTAALCVMALLDHPDFPARAQVLVTGAAGGVGSIAVALLASLGHEVIASTGRAEERDYLERLGARHVIAREQLERSAKPLERESWHGVVDTVGGQTLATACATTRWNGAIAACGLAGSSSFPATVMPFILRNVTLYGINSVMVANARRQRAWELIANHLDKQAFPSFSSQIPLSAAISYAPAFMAGKVRGRTVVLVSRDDP